MFQPRTVALVSCFAGILAPLLAGEVPADLMQKARSGDAGAQFEASRHFKDERGLGWLRKAAEQGHAPAQLKLAELFEAGKGVPQSSFEANVFYRLASGHDESIAGQKRTETKLTPKQLDDARERVITDLALTLVHPRRFGAPGLIGKTRGWYVWKKWDPKTGDAEVTRDPPGEVYKVRVLPWATTYRHLAYGDTFDELLFGEKMNMFFDPDGKTQRGFVVHFQDEISQMKGHGHAWKIREVKGPHAFVAQVFAGEKPLDDKTYAFEIDPACRKWREGKVVDDFPLRVDQRCYMTWVYRDERRVAMLLTDDASLDTLKKLATERIDARLAKVGLGGRLEDVDGTKAHFMVYSTYWAQAGRLKPGQAVELVAQETRIPAKVLSHKNRGQYGSGVNDVILQLRGEEDAVLLRKLDGGRATMRLSLVGVR